MKVSHQILIGVAIIGLGIGCSELNNPIPDITTNKCDVCHAEMPPNDSAMMYSGDSTVTGIHFVHVMSESLSCESCHYGYDKKTKKWNLPSNHFSDSIRFDSSRCVKCHNYRDCDLCHSSPPNSSPVSKKIHDLHAMKVDAVTGDTTGYNCGFCHKGYDIENLKSPLDLPWDLHDNGDTNVIFDLPFPTNPEYGPNYDNTIGACDFVYCHGTTITGGKDRVTIYDPIDTIGNAECNFCHDTVQLAINVPEHARDNHVEYFKDCLNCHANYRLRGSVTHKTNHINGSTDQKDTDCSSCHPDMGPVF